MTSDELIAYYQSNPPNPTVRLHVQATGDATVLAVLVDFFVYDTAEPNADPVHAVVYFSGIFVVVPSSRVSLPQ